ncbi:DUF3987 domain-containing protein [Halomonas sp. TRM85114]|uniref:DUF3987 domain-containing protein n=1 Tax=Halomonas jincaotanensis TaxID=2810616 RepID=UPI001BD689EE|nr:DUF3987 domain-containing protein [Halomonas jincaotanensis]MBS9404792.1 DUF3987 domain-containing protein [Halomonas jincaotanensis]
MSICGEKLTDIENQNSNDMHPVAKVNESSANEFIKILGGCDFSIFQTFDDKEKKRRDLAQTFHGPLRDTHGQLIVLNKQGAGVFLCLNITDGAGRKAKNITSVRGLFADFDEPQTLASMLSYIEGAGLPKPTIVVETSPGKYHCHWLTQEPGEIALEEFKPLQQALARACGSDPSVCDLSRVVRLPGFMHHKNEPFAVRTVLQGRRHTSQILRNSLGPYMVESSQQSKVAPENPLTSVGSITYASRALEKAASSVRAADVGKRNDTLNREAFGLFGLVKGGHVAESEVRETLTRGAMETGLNEGEIQATLSSAWRAAMPRNVSAAQEEPSRYSFSAANEAKKPATQGTRNMDPRPLPLASRSSLPRYPMEALGPLLGEAAERFAWHVQAPEGMAGQSVLAAAALVVQGHVDVARGLIGMGPTSLFCITDAESGERKSTLERLSLRPVRDWERVRREFQREESARYKAEYEAWHLRRQSLVSVAKGKSDKVIESHEQERLAQLLADHELNEPSTPVRPQMTFEEPTQEGIYRHFQEGHPSAGLFSDEGVGFFGGHGMREENRGRTIATLSKLWDGGSISRTRGAVGESGVLAGRRLSAHLMLQPVVAAQVMGDPLLTGQGFLARFLFMRAPSLIGGRFLLNRDPRYGVEHETAVGHYWEALAEVVNRPLDVDQETGELRPKLAKIEGDAFRAWAEFHDKVERELGKSGRLSLVKGFASKAADNAARIAAIFSYIEGGLHPQVAHIERAVALMDYYLQSMASQVEEAQDDQREFQAREVLDAIHEKFGGQLSAHDFKRMPSAYRSAKKLRSLLGLLVDAGYLEICLVNNQNKPSGWVAISPES